MKKVFSMIGLLLLTSILMVGCGAAQPKDTVKVFFTAFKDGDLKKASTYVKGDIDLTRNGDAAENKKVLEAISKRFSFEEPKEVSNEKDKAVVSVKVKSVDVSEVFKKVIEEMKPQLNSGKITDQEEMNKMVSELLIKHMQDKDIDLVSRTEKLNLKKNKDGEYKILSDDNFRNAFFANQDKVQGILQGME
ncbi:DUF5105 domain-containing protein [Rummeliibacillus sp. G93]|uniref:DUF5105 domain-containing protein n=1 Tax=Rummeliibacillus TaxID=648802 RepID=UPI00201BE9BD|nr:DUF5105 domain-containing protein [Rummeliibacillus sp. G93]UQW96918.1 DUF5105 domain-containing protein [Rummeliibacillus sp. G93]